MELLKTIGVVLYAWFVASCLTAMIFALIKRRSYKEPYTMSKRTIIVIFALLVILAGFIAWIREG